MLRIGRVNYLNTEPLFYRLSGFEIVEGFPAELVKELREGKIDGGIVSSAELFLNPDLYRILPSISISSRERVCSVLLLSKKPIEEVRKIRITPSSLTSRYLLFYLLKEVYSLKAEEVVEGEDAFLSIGDEALREKDKFPYSYDLGEMWFREKGLPFVFALFLLRKDASLGQARELLERLKGSLKAFFDDLERGLCVNSEFEREYFLKCIDYGLEEDHLRSLSIFFSFLERETGKPAPDISDLFLPL